MPGLIRLALALAFFAAPILASAEKHEYYVNKGVKYHIGDNRYGNSEDSSFMQTYPVVGQEWIEVFTVDRPDVVHVRIEHIWGVDDCPYCKILVSINDRDMGRITQENNHEPYTTLEPLAQKVVPGVKYYLKIASYGQNGQVDDFVMENVVVETEEANLKFLEPGPIIQNPGDNLPKFKPEVDTGGGCMGTRKLADWLPTEDTSQGVMRLKSVDRFDTRDLAVKLAPNDYVEAHLKINTIESGDLVKQAFEVLYGSTDKSGWVISFAPGAAQAFHGNMMRGGVYRSKKFGVNLRAGAWATLRVARCPDGMGVLYINDVEIGEGIMGLGPTESVTIRSRGISADLASRTY